MTSTSEKPALYLIPAPLGSADTPWLLPHEASIAAGLVDFVVEEEKTARSFLKALNVLVPIRDLNLATLNEHSPPDIADTLLQPLREGRSLGMMSEAGCPAVADPGALLVAAAHRAGFPVVPFTGPCGILMALMVSGANGQQFSFKGYLPRDSRERQASLQLLQQHARTAKETQIFIETPYRNEALLADALACLHPETFLCVAADLTLASQTVVSKSVGEWRKMPLPDLKKRPCTFVLWA